MSEVLNKSTATLVAPRVGSYWEGQGGIYVGVMPGIDGGRDYCLIASTEEGSGLTWGPYGIRLEGTQSKRDGLSNTRALVASGLHQAAQWAAGYTKDGQTDFYLPAQRELNLCYATSAEHFVDDWYWSSTQFSALSAWCQYFDDGTQSNASKTTTGRARAVRRLFI